jgi:hypothetical protein
VYSNRMNRAHALVVTVAMAYFVGQWLVR